jgi:hypothetical protein
MPEPFKATKKNFYGVMLWNGVMVIMLLFAVFVAGINDAGIGARIVFYGVWVLLEVIGLATLIAYVYHLWFKPKR